MFKKTINNYIFFDLFCEIFYILNFFYSFVIYDRYIILNEVFFCYFNSCFVL